MHAHTSNLSHAMHAHGNTQRVHAPTISSQHKALATTPLQPHPYDTLHQAPITHAQSPLATTYIHVHTTPSNIYNDRSRPCHYLRTSRSTIHFCCRNLAFPTSLLPFPFSLPLAPIVRQHSFHTHAHARYCLLSYASYPSHTQADRRPEPRTPCRP
jgi:hypothetical protein